MNYINDALVVRFVYKDDKPYSLSILSQDDTKITPRGDFSFPANNGLFITSAAHIEVNVKTLYIRGTNTTKDGMVANIDHLKCEDVNKIREAVKELNQVIRNGELTNDRRQEVPF